MGAFLRASRGRGLSVVVCCSKGSSHSMVETVGRAILVAGFRAVV